MNTRKILNHIIDQATRKDRASQDVKYLITDLEIIKRLAKEAVSTLNP